ncbi:Uma2 family endonuclease [Streptomyces sp. NBC_01373]|uniref:Uma2 family endonuclease n=1 Tax=Streptomyces sp. NBC_01373 TaxID=2903843 RepID=UPI0022522DC9|nr:Uma2 family endonuclease [Streptomyces sp. NBC_01373]MCX4699850.1 Uma2 family endonuclease [Streptomyces sp. NBC_01373]
MTPGTAERPQMPIEDFEELASVAPEHVRLEFVDGRVRTKDPLSVEDFEELERRAPETVRLEYVNGKLEVKAMPDGNHRSIHVWLVRQFLLQRPDLDLVPESGVKAEAYRKGRARTDAALAPVDHFRGHGEWSETDGILLALEITSHDRDNNTLTVFSEPKDGRYHQSVSYPWGDTVQLPSPVDITLDTEKLKDYAD